MVSRRRSSKAACPRFADPHPDPPPFRGRGQVLGDLFPPSRTGGSKWSAISFLPLKGGGIRWGSVAMTAHRAIKSLAGWEADERPEPRSLGLLPSGPDPVGEWLVHRQPPGRLYRPGRARKQVGAPSSSSPAKRSEAGEGDHPERAIASAG